MSCKITKGSVQNTQMIHSLEPDLQIYYEPSRLLDHVSLSVLSLRTVVWLFPAGLAWAAPPWSTETAVTLGDLGHCRGSETQRAYIACHGLVRGTSNPSWRGRESRNTPFRSHYCCENVGRHDSTHLQSQHLGGRYGRMRSSKPALAL